MAWKRSGECNGCGDCCKGDPFDGAKGAPEVADYCFFFRWHGPSGRCVDRTETNPYYLSGCNVWPTDPTNIADKPNCSYSFTEVEGE